MESFACHKCRIASSTCIRADQCTHQRLNREMREVFMAMTVVLRGVVESRRKPFKLRAYARCVVSLGAGARGGWGAS